MAVVRLEIKTRRPLADGRKFDQVGCYEQLDGTAHFAVDPAHRLNCSVTDINLAERGRDGLIAPGNGHSQPPIAQSTAYCRAP